MPTGVIIALFVLAPIAGLLGGLASGLKTRFDHRVRLLRGQEVSVGILGDALLGIIASMGAIAVSGTLLGLDWTNYTKPDFIPRVFGIALVGGFGGLKTLEALLNQVGKELDKARKEAETNVAVENLLREAAFLRQYHYYSEAAQSYRAILEIDKASEKALIGLALVESYKQPPDLDKAIRLLDQVVEINGSNEHALYNRACIRAVRDGAKGKLEWLPDLQRAIKLYPRYRDMAERDADFKPFEADPDFRKAVTG